MLVLTMEAKLIGIVGGTVSIEMFEKPTNLL
jgi:hypothetical protein